MAKCIHKLNEVNAQHKLLEYPLEADCEFKSPIFLPSSPRLQIYLVSLKKGKRKPVDGSDNFFVYQVVDMIQKTNRETKKKYTELGVLVQGAMKKCPLEADMQYSK